VSAPSTPEVSVKRGGRQATVTLQGTGRVRLRGRAHKLALTVHVLTAVGWFGAAGFVAFALIVAGTTGDARLASALYRTIETSVWLTIPLGVVTLVDGAVLSVGTIWGLVRHWWVVAKIAIVVVVVVTDATLVRAGAHDALTGGSAGRAMYGPVIAHCVVLTVATALSVFKPRGRTPFGRARADARPAP